MPCSGIELVQGFIFAARAALSWCWPDYPGATYYEVAERWGSDRGAGVLWVDAGSVLTPGWQVQVALFEEVEVRYRACDVFACSDWSPSSQRVRVISDLDFDADGLIGAGDFNVFRRVWRSYGGGRGFNSLRLVFSHFFIAGIYWPPDDPNLPLP